MPVNEKLSVLDVDFVNSVPQFTLLDPSKETSCVLRRLSFQTSGQKIVFDVFLYFDVVRLLSVSLIFMVKGCATVPLKTNQPTTSLSTIMHTLQYLSYVYSVGTVGISDFLFFRLSYLLHFAS